MPIFRLRLASLVLMFLGFSGALYFGSQVNSSNHLVPPKVNNATFSDNDTSQPAPTNVLPRSEPSRLRITKIGVDSSLIPVGRGADQTLQVPDSPWQVGWYTHAPTPGEIGPAVLVGHVDSQEGPAVFWRLGELVAGDIIEIDRVDQTVAKFKVDSVKQFSQDAFPTNEVYSDINFAGIRLITCSGTFDRQTGHYTHNTVVYGSLISL